MNVVEPIMLRPREVAALLGLAHASPSVTLNIYAHLIPGDEDAAVMRLQARLGGR